MFWPRSGLVWRTVAISQTKSTKHRSILGQNKSVDNFPQGMTRQPRKKLVRRGRV